MNERHALEVRLVRVETPKRWRWDVTEYRCTDYNNPGVYDSRVHLSRRVGYTYSWLGAALSLAGCVSRAGALDAAPTAGQEADT